MSLVKKISQAVVAPEASRPLTAALAKKLGKSPRDYRSQGQFLARPEVPDSDDLQRVLALPVREPPGRDEQERMASEMTARLALPAGPCKCRELSGEQCLTRLRPIQGWALHEAASSIGLVGMLRVGAGKTGLDVLLPMVVPGTRRAVLLIPASLRSQFALDYQRWGQHFRVPNIAGGHGIMHADRPVLHVLSYSELSSPRFAVMLKSIKPDLIIGDELQHLRNRSSARGSRFLRFFLTCANCDHEESDHPRCCGCQNFRDRGVRFCGHSGSFTRGSLDDFAHLSLLALREGSPLPLDPATVRDWCGVIDATFPGLRPAPGALKQLQSSPFESPRAAFRRRLLRTKGVVSTADAELTISLVLRTRDVAIPAGVQRLLDQTRASAMRPDGEELVEQLEVVATCRQIASGFYMRWKYPRGEPEDLIKEWFTRRSEWHRELRKKLEVRQDHMDSPLLCKQAAQRYLQGYSGDLPTWRSETYAPWAQIADRVQPESDVVWIDDYLVRDAAAWARSAVGLIWTEHPAFGHAIAKLAHLPYYGAGEKASAEIILERGDRSIVASSNAHSQGKNLQMFSRMLVAQPVSDWEQCIGRLHREGQRAECVTVDLYQHTSEFVEAFEKAVERAKYVFESTGKSEKLLYAERGKNDHPLRSRRHCC